MALFDGYFGGAKKRKAQIDKTLSEGTTPKPSIRAAQPAVAAPRKKKAPFVAPRKPIHIRQADYPAWVERRRQAYESQ